MQKIILTYWRCLVILACLVSIPLYAGMLQFDSTPLCRTEKIPGLASLAFGDLNGDGLPDVLANALGTNQATRATRAAAEILVFYNRAGKLPESPDMKIPFPGCFSVAVYDCDQDGKNDIVVAEGLLLHILCHKDGFDLGKKHTSFNTNQRAGFSLQICKINSNGLFDVLLGPVWRKIDKNNSGFRVENGYLQGPKISNNKHSYAVDVNVDGLMDIICRAGTDLRVYYGPITAMIVDPAELSDFLELKVPGYIHSLAVADLNCDNMPDLVVSHQGNQPGTYIYYQNEPAAFDADASPSATINAGGSVYTPDLAGSGIATLVILYRSSMVGFFHPAPGRAIPDDPANFDQVLSLPITTELYFADMDGDGRQEMIRQGHDGTIAVYACQPVNSSGD